MQLMCASLRATTAVFLLLVVGPVAAAAFGAEANRCEGPECIDWSRTLDGLSAARDYPFEPGPWLLGFGADTLVVAQHREIPFWEGFAVIRLDSQGETIWQTSLRATEGEAFGYWVTDATLDTTRDRLILLGFDWTDDGHQPAVMWLSPQTGEILDSRLLTVPSDAVVTQVQFGPWLGSQNLSVIHDATLYLNGTDRESTMPAVAIIDAASGETRHWVNLPRDVSVTSAAANAEQLALILEGTGVWQTQPESWKALAIITLPGGWFELESLSADMDAIPGVAYAGFHVEPMEVVALPDGAWAIIGHAITRCGPPPQVVFGRVFPRAFVDPCMVVEGLYVARQIGKFQHHVTFIHFPQQDPSDSGRAPIATELLAADVDGEGNVLVYARGKDSRGHLVALDLADSTCRGLQGPDHTPSIGFPSWPIYQDIANMEHDSVTGLTTLAGAGVDDRGVYLHLQVVDHRQNERHLDTLIETAIPLTNPYDVLWQDSVLLDGGRVVHGHGIWGSPASGRIDSLSSGPAAPVSESAVICVRGI